LETLFELKKPQKILDRAEFLLLSKQGKKIQDNFFIVLYTPGKCPWPRLGVTVSKRVGNAVNRNRIKRRIREWFRLRKGMISGNWDISIIAKKSAAGMTFDQVSRSLENLVVKIRGS
jgi:ribonuclease P protein component